MLSDMPAPASCPLEGPGPPCRAAPSRGAWAGEGSPAAEGPASHEISQESIQQVHKAAALDPLMPQGICKQCVGIGIRWHGQALSSWWPPPLAREHQGAGSEAQGLGQEGTFQRGGVSIMRGAEAFVENPMGCRLAQL